LKKDTITVMLNPELKHAHEVLTEAFAKHKFVVIFGSCTATYQGRGASRLGPGDRMVVIKPDGAMLVHRPTGYSPVNWQPDSQVIATELRDEGLLVRSVRGKPREVLELVFTKLYAIVVIEGLEDTAEFIEYMDEAELRDYLASNPEEIEPGLRVIRIERPIGEGYADIVARDREGRYVIIEVKRVNAGKDAVQQLHRYIEKFRSENPAAPVRGILVAPSISKEAKKLLEKLGLEYRQVNIAEIYRKAVETGEIKRDTKTRSLLEFFTEGSKASQLRHQLGRGL